MEEKLRYSDEELQEFKELIMEKLALARGEFQQLRANLIGVAGNDTADTEPTLKNLEESTDLLSKAELGRLCERQRKFIDHLEKALMRIENKTYGICRATGRLIPKERLRAVPHATLSIEAKK